MELREIQENDFKIKYECKRKYHDSPQRDFNDNNILSNLYVEK